MTLANRISNALLSLVLRITCRLDIQDLKDKVPMEGPMIIVSNHISTLEGPLLYLFMRPRHTIALAKQELWEKSFTRHLMQWWECIPVNREGMDREALNACFSVLDRKDILCIAPEGTRTEDGRLIQGKAGTGFIAFKKKVQILPIANYGIEDFSKNIRRLRRTPVTIKVGKPFIIESDKRRLNNEERQQVTDEMMLRIAELMPSEYHGFYADKVGSPYIFTKDVSQTL